MGSGCTGRGKLLNGRDIESKDSVGVFNEVRCHVDGLLEALILGRPRSQAILVAIHQTFLATSFYITDPFARILLIEYEDLKKDLWPYMSLVI